MSIRERILLDDLKVQLEEALHSNEIQSIDVSNCASTSISETLHKFVYREQREAGTPAYVRAVYADGSQGNPFPLRCLPRRGKGCAPELGHVFPLRVAMISMRHNDMDALVDMAWLVNREIPREALASVESFSYERARQFLREELQSGPLKLHFYQTGYQPVIIGFYRALIDELLSGISRPLVLEVVPFYYVACIKDYMPGQPWN